MSQGRQRQNAALRKAAAKKSKTTHQAAERALRKMIKNGEQVTFSAVARAAGVTRQYLSRHPELGPRIRTLSDASTPGPPEAIPAQRPADEPSIVTVLRNRVRTEQERHRKETAELREQKQELEAQLAAAHAEILRLRTAYESSPEHLKR